MAGKNEEKNKNSDKSIKLTNEQTNDTKTDSVKSLCEVKRCFQFFFSSPFLSLSVFVDSARMLENLNLIDTYVQFFETKFEMRKLGRNNRKTEISFIGPTLKCATDTHV